MVTCASCGHEAAEAFKFCPECGAPAAVTAPAREQRKVVTVLFCDVTGSTALGERLDLESLRTLLARYFECMKAIVERHGGTVGEVFALAGRPAEAVTAFEQARARYEDNGNVAAADRLRVRLTELHVVVPA
jgi:class 3 adenylate cyclase